GAVRALTDGCALRAEHGGGHRRTDQARRRLAGHGEEPARNDAPDRPRPWRAHSPQARGALRAAGRGLEDGGRGGEPRVRHAGAAGRYARRPRLATAGPHPPGGSAQGGARALRALAGAALGARPPAPDLARAKDLRVAAPSLLALRSPRSVPAPRRHGERLKSNTSFPSCSSAS